MYDINLLELLICTTLASFGGIVKLLVEIEKKPRKKVIAAHFITAAIISFFVGIVTYAICKNYGISPLMTISLVAIAGFFGAPTMSLLATLPLKHITFTHKDILDKHITKKQPEERQHEDRMDN